LNKIRLEKQLVLYGAGSRKEIKKIIRSGKVTVNGEIVIDEGTIINKEDIVLINGLPQENKILRYFILYKVAGYVTAMKDEKEATVKELLPKEIANGAFFPVGRLDKDTEGLLIFTNDGDLNRILARPEYKVEKTYYVELIKEISEDEIKKLEKGIEINNHICLPSKVERVAKDKINLTITEGKFHQVKRMLRAVNNKVTYLKRIRFGNITLEDMKKEELREIRKEDIIDF